MIQGTKTKNVSNSVTRINLIHDTSKRFRGLVGENDVTWFLGGQTTLPFSANTINRGPLSLLWTTKNGELFILKMIMENYSVEVIIVSFLGYSSDRRCPHIKQY